MTPEQEMSDTAPTTTGPQQNPYPPAMNGKAAD